MKEFIVETDLDLSCVAEFGAGGISFKPHGELIRCKECKHWERGRCEQNDYSRWNADGFCSWAERKDN